MSNLLIIFLLALPFIIYLVTKKIMRTHIIFGAIFILLMTFSLSLQVIIGNIFTYTWIPVMIKLFITIIIFDLYRYSIISHHVEEMLDAIIRNKRGLPIITFFLAGIVAFYFNIMIAIIMMVFILYTMKIPKTLVMTVIVIIMSVFTISSNGFAMVDKLIESVNQNINVINYLTENNIQWEAFSKEIIEVIQKIYFVTFISFYFVIIYMVFYSFFKLGNLKFEIRANFILYLAPLMIFFSSTLIFENFLSAENSYVIALLFGLISAFYFNEAGKDKLVKDFESPIKMEKEIDEKKLYISSFFDILILIMFLLFLNFESNIWFIFTILIGGILIFYLIKKYTYTKKEWKSIFKENTLFILKSLSIVLIMSVSFQILIKILQNKLLGEEVFEASFLFNSLFLLLIHNFVIGITEFSGQFISEVNASKIGYASIIFYIGIGTNLLVWYIIGNFIDSDDNEIYISFWIYTVGYIFINLAIIILILLAGLR